MSARVTCGRCDKEVAVRVVGNGTRGRPVYHKGDDGETCEGTFNEFDLADLPL